MRDRDDALMEDAMIAARESGEPVEEIIARWKASERFGAFARSLDISPEILAGFGSEEDGRFYVYVKGPSDPGLAAAVAEPDLDVEYRTGASLSRVDQSLLADAIGPMIFALGHPKKAWWDAGPDEATVGIQTSEPEAFSSLQDDIEKLVIAMFPDATNVTTTVTIN